MSAPQLCRQHVALGSSRAACRRRGRIAPTQLVCHAADTLTQELSTIYSVNFGWAAFSLFNSSTCLSRWALDVADVPRLGKQVAFWRRQRARQPALACTQCLPSYVPAPQLPGLLLVLLCRRLPVHVSCACARCCAVWIPW